MLLWAISGLILPIWLGIVQTRSGGELNLTAIFHFFLSQMLCGLIATTMSYFILTFIAVRYFYPRLMSREPAEHHEVEQLGRLDRRIWLYYWLSVAVPFLAFPLLVYVAELRFFIIILSILGIAGFALAYNLDRAIRGDLATLAQIINPAGSSLASSETSDSFLTSSKRDTLIGRGGTTHRP